MSVWVKTVSFQRVLGARFRHLAAWRALHPPSRSKSTLVYSRHEDGLMVYRGVSFAAPPVGDLRWRAPQLAAKWTGISPSWSGVTAEDLGQGHTSAAVPL